MSRLRTVLLALAVSSPFATACKKQEEKPAEPTEESIPAEEADSAEGTPEGTEEAQAPEPLNAAVVDRFIAFEKELNEKAAEPRKAIRESMGQPAAGANRADLALKGQEASIAFARLQDSLREKHKLSDTHISALRLAGSQLLTLQAGQGGSGNAAQEAALKQRREQIAALPPDQRAGMEASLKQMEAQLAGEGAFTSLRQAHGDAAAEAARARRDDLLSVTRERIAQETGKTPGSK